VALTGLLELQQVATWGTVGVVEEEAVEAVVVVAAEEEAVEAVVVVAAEEVVEAVGAEVEAVNQDHYCTYRGILDMVAS
jgi:hypothetical protein